MHDEPEQVRSLCLCLSLAQTALWATGPNPVYETGKEIANWNKVATGNNDTQQNNLAETWSSATWLCNDNQHSFSLPKQSNGTQRLM